MKRTVLACFMVLLTCCAAFAQRLPGGATPNHYTLSFNIDFPNNNFDGDESIDLVLDKPSKTITLNALEIDFHEVTVTAAGQTQAAQVSTDEKNETATFTVANELPAGVAAVHINYTGHLNDKLRGLYLSTYKGRKYAVTQMEATDARVAFPSFDDLLTRRPLTSSPLSTRMTPPSRTTRSSPTRRAPATSTPLSSQRRPKCRATSSPSRSATGSASTTRSMASN